MVLEREVKTQRAPFRPIRHATFPQLLGPPIGRLRRLPHLHENVGRRRRLVLGGPIRHRCVVAKLARQRRHCPGHLVRWVVPCLFLTTNPDAQARWASSRSS